MRRALALVVSILLLGGCGTPFGDETPPTSTVEPTSSTIVDDDPIEPATTASVPGPVAGKPALLIADDTGVRVVAGDDIWATFLVGSAAALAIPDLNGGVVYQGPVSEPIGSHWDDALGRLVFEWSEGPEPIRHIETVGAAGEIIVSHPDARLALIDVALIHGTRQVVYRMLIGGPGGDAAWEQVLEWLMLYDLETGQTTRLGLIGSYESSKTEMRFGRDHLAVTFDAYGESMGTKVGFLPVTDLDLEVEYDWLPTLAIGALVYGPGIDCERTLACDGWAVATIAADDSRLTWAQGGFDIINEIRAPRPIEVIEVDLETGAEIRSTTVVEAPSVIIDPHFHRARLIDDDGTWIVLSGVEAESLIYVIGPEGTVELVGSGGTASIWEP